jgi:hypothetical protein
MRAPVVNQTMIVKQEDNSYTKEKVLEVRKKYMLLTGLPQDKFREHARTFNMETLMLKDFCMHNVECFYEEDLPEKNNFEIGQIFYIVSDRSDLEFKQLELIEVHDEHFVFKGNSKYPKTHLYTRRTLEPFVPKHEIRINIYPDRKMLTKNIQLNTLYSELQKDSLMGELDKENIIDTIFNKMNSGKYSHLCIEKLNEILDLAKD